MNNDTEERLIPKAVGYTILQYRCKGEIIKIKHPECPYCDSHGKTLWDAGVSKEDNYCRHCGQKLDWSNWTDNVD